MILCRLLKADTIRCIPEDRMGLPIQPIVLSAVSSIAGRTDKSGCFQPYRYGPISGSLCRATISDPDSLHGSEIKVTQNGALRLPVSLQKAPAGADAVIRTIQPVPGLMGISIIRNMCCGIIPSVRGVLSCRKMACLFRFIINGSIKILTGAAQSHRAGCGPTCFAMVVSYLTGQTITPADVVAWCGNAYYVPGDGTSWSFFDGLRNTMGSERLPTTTSAEEVMVALSEAIR